MDVCYVLTSGRYDKLLVGVYTDLAVLKAVLPNYDETHNTWYGTAEREGDCCSVTVQKCVANDPTIQFVTDYYDHPIQGAQIQIVKQGKGEG